MKKSANPNRPLSGYELKKKRVKKERRRNLAVFVIFLLAFAALLYFGSGILSGRFRQENSQPTNEVTNDLLFTAEVLFATPTGTATLSPTPTVPTPTPTATHTATATNTPTPTLSPTPKFRPVRSTEEAPATMLELAEQTMEAEHAKMFTPTPLPEGDVLFELLGEGTLFDPALVYENAECTWMGVAGNLTDRRGNPQIGYYIRVGFPDGTVSETLSGLYPVYGEAGYEVTLARPVQEFRESIWIQIFDSERLPVSERVYFRPMNDCSKSGILFNFVRIGTP